MKEARIIFITLILLGIAGGVLAFKVKKFTLNPVYISTETIFTTSVGGIFYATTDPLIRPFCSTVPLFYFTTNPGQALTVEAWQTTWYPFPRRVTFTLIGGTETLTRLIPYCTSTTTLMTTAI
jgi:hypothetical protein